MGYIYVETDVPWQRGGARGAEWPDAMPPWFLADWRDAYGVAWQGVVEVAAHDDPRPVADDVDWVDVIQWAEFGDIP